MSIVQLYSGINPNTVKKQVQLLKVDGKYYIELEEFENTDCILELCLSLATENQALREKIDVLEEKVLIYKKEVGH